MSDDPLDSIPAFDRVSFRALLVHEGQDARAALSAAGLIDAVELPVVIGEQVDLSGVLLGDGVTPNPTALLEIEPEVAPESQGSPQLNQPLSAGGDFQAWSQTATRTLAPAYGIQPLAPVRPRGSQN